jgi:hypothetical protein
MRAALIAIACLVLGGRVTAEPGPKVIVQPERGPWPDGVGPRAEIGQSNPTLLLDLIGEGELIVEGRYEPHAIAYWSCAREGPKLLGMDAIGRVKKRGLDIIALSKPLEANEGDIVRIRARLRVVPSTTCGPDHTMAEFDTLAVLSVRSTAAPRALVEAYHRAHAAELDRALARVHQGQREPSLTEATRFHEYYDAANGTLLFFTDASRPLAMHSDAVYSVGTSWRRVEKIWLWRWFQGE